MKQPLVSVVIPTYNRAYCLGRAIDSALQQTYQNVEVIVVDDGSTDGTAVLVNAEYGDNPRVRYLQQPNQGVAAARNTGLAAAGGAFIALLDSDDIWYPWKLTVQVAVLRHFPQAGMVWTDMQAIDAAGQVTHAKYLRTMYDAYRWFHHEDLFSETHSLGEAFPELGHDVQGAAVSVGDICSQMLMGNLVHTSTVLLRRERLEAVGGFDPELGACGEDYDFHLRTCREGPVAFIDASTIQYQRDFTDQLTQPAYALVFAQSYLATVTRTLEQDRDRIRLPQSMIDAALADAHGWIGQAAMDRGDMVLARKHLARSLYYAPRQLRTASMLLLASLPRSAGNRLREQYRRMKQLLRSSGSHAVSETPSLRMGSDTAIAR